MLLTGTGKLGGGGLVFERYMQGMVPTCLDVVTVTIPRMLKKACMMRDMFSCPKVKTLSCRDTECRSCGLLVLLYVVSKVLIVFYGVIDRAVGRRVSPHVGSRMVARGSRMMRK